MNGYKIVYSYDLKGNRQTESSARTVDNINSNFTCSYDSENKLKTVVKNGTTTTMSYSADGMRAKKQAGTNSSSYIYNLSGKLIAEARNSSTVTANYVWGPDRVISKKEATGGEYYYLYNGHGDVVQMVDKSGNVANNYNYDEWGNISTSNEIINNPFKYAGEVYDQETGLYYLRARYYDPKMGRLINEDSYEGEITNPLSMNIYTYSSNNPIKYVDPSGHKIVLAGDTSEKNYLLGLLNEITNYELQYNDAGLVFNNGYNEDEEEYRNGNKLIMGLINSSYTCTIQVIYLIGTVNDICAPHNITDAEMGTPTDCTISICQQPVKVPTEVSGKNYVKKTTINPF